MADLLDIAPSTSVVVVKIDDLRIKVHGVSIDAIASIISRFPELKSFLNGGLSDSTILSRLVESCGAAVGPIIAAGCGHCGEEAYEQRGAMLLPEQQLKLLRAIFGLTFPLGIGCFVKELTALMGGMSEGEKIVEVKVRLRKSPSASQPSSEVASLPIMQ